MQKINQGQDIISFYSILARPRAIQDPKFKRGLIMAIVSAFFITSFILAAVNYGYKVFSGNGAPSLNIAEGVAYIPGTFVSNDIAKGYVGK